MCIYIKTKINQFIEHNDKLHRLLMNKFLFLYLLNLLFIYFSFSI